MYYNDRAAIKLLVPHVPLETQNAEGKTAREKAAEYYPLLLPLLEGNG